MKAAGLCTRHYGSIEADELNSSLLCLTCNFTWGNRYIVFRRFGYYSVQTPPNVFFSGAVNESFFDIALRFFLKGLYF